MVKGASSPRPAAAAAGGHSGHLQPKEYLHDGTTYATGQHHLMHGCWFCRTLADSVVHAHLEHHWSETCGQIAQRFEHAQIGQPNRCKQQ